jgi:hypothetical protein
MIGKREIERNRAGSDGEILMKTIFPFINMYIFLVIVVCFLLLGKSYTVTLRPLLASPFAPNVPGFSLSFSLSLSDNIASVFAYGDLGNIQSALIMGEKSVQTKKTKKK